MKEDIKNNDLVWILYRKQPWPAMVKRVYPKKITYNFLPAKNHPNVFSTALKNVKIMNETDKLPSGASEEQREAYDIAMQLLKGGVSDEFEENNIVVENGENVVDEEEEVAADENGDESDVSNNMKNVDEKIPKKSARLSPQKRSHKKLQNADSVPSTSSTQSSSKKLVQRASLNQKQLALKKKESTGAGSGHSSEVASAQKKRGRPSKGAEQVLSSKKTKSVTKKVTEYEMMTSDDDYNDDDEKTSLTEDDEYVPVAKGASHHVLKKSTIIESMDSSDGEEEIEEGKANKSVNMKEWVTDTSHVSYQPDDVVVLQTPNGMWPGKVINVDDDELIYQMFPLDNFLDKATINVDMVVPFPSDQVDKLIDENKNTYGLYNAFKAVKEYLENRAKSASKSPEKTVKVAGVLAAKECDGGNSNSKSPASISKVNGVKEFSTTSSSEQTLSSGKNKNETNLEKTKRVAKSLQASGDNETPSTRGRKRRFIAEEPEAESGTESSTNDHQKALKGESKKIDEKKGVNQKSLPPPIVSDKALPKPKRARLDTNDAASLSSTSSTIQKVLPNGNTESSPSTRKRLGLGRMAPSIKNKEVSSKKIVEHSASKKKEKLSDAKTNVQFLAVLLSDETGAYLGKIWANELEPSLSTSVNYVKPQFVSDLKIEFATNGLLSMVEDLEAAVNEIRNWIVLCTKLPKMSLLAELDYIGNVALPEACVFALSQVENCSLKSAAVKFQSSATAELIASSSSSAKRKNAGNRALGNGINGASKMDAIDDASATTSLSTSAPAEKPQDSSAVQYDHQPFNDLVLAATIMQDKEKY